MMNLFRKIFLKNMGLKFTAFILTLALWFYIVSELHKGSEEDQRLLNNVFPRENMSAKKLTIKPVFTGKTRYGYAMDSERVVVVPEYCIVVGTKALLENITYAYTLPIDIGMASWTFTKSVALSPIAPGVYMEETLVQVVVPIEKVGS
ncbi:MAG: hypothetical protein WC738_05370 [Candidatus Omnitrophota bacterium]|jgi:hypothetical protein